MSEAAPAPDNTTNILKHRLQHFLQKREPPKTFCPSDVARGLTTQDLSDCHFDSWRDAMPAIRETAWTMRDEALLEVVQKGEPVGHVELKDIKGPIRIRRVAS
ncbi:hypothetical protein CLAFUW4_04142 [Fulvia fulva]|uniref:Uncharacterized protein n=1 Tax=Passalora fulva TaxID=5499 RepID=A0A9Q8LGD1_PASFU|nr:uncharacterized protein CLAFUR5_04104 [Fulvia fulva]KAK4627215.1 hypothetical protein CLAFUR4_04128 [Fulvia fulva]KAK4628261.1 hypothetical protein CLAFUR0_04129 [Fulvia fulva]UJO16957.1 hypothetical protein CLAFUR5_04104 [Fulvia fulva]WPV13451.1 hypothetical protein CLAFUW4_04142 [Fulvia fulva]WPV28268.1 hypothetical protein CLAFUW7_04131 [Fulvia fulva]